MTAPAAPQLLPIGALDGSSARLDWRSRAIIAVGGLVLRLLSRTWRFRCIGRSQCDALRKSGRSVIITFWHGQMLPLAAEHRSPTTVLISDHRDGEIIARVMRAFGLRSVRGSSSRGATRALLQMSRTLSAGQDIAIAPDGPRGPRHSFAQGPLIAAQRTGAPIVLLASHCRHVWQLKTWDGLQIPKPFARVTVVYDEPLYVVASDARDATRQAEVVRQRLQWLQLRAEHPDAKPPMLPATSGA